MYRVQISQSENLAGPKEKSTNFMISSVRFVSHEENDWRDL